MVVRTGLGSCARIYRLGGGIMSIYYNDEENHYDLYLNEMYDKRYRFAGQAVYDGTLKVIFVELLPDINGTGRLHDVPEEDYTRFAVERFWEMITPEALDKARQKLIDSYKNQILDYKIAIEDVEAKISAINA